jgi:polar amino acid transport system substrate-binding protein
MRRSRHFIFNIFLIWTFIASNIIRQAHAEIKISPDIASILTRGEIRVAMTEEYWPPFFYLNKNKELAGLDVDLATELANKLGVRVKFLREAKTFDEIVDMVVDRRADIAVAYLSDTLERAKLVRFTPPYVQLKPAILVNRQLATISRRGTNLSKLLNHPNAKVGVTKGSSAEYFAALTYPLSQIIPYDTWQDITKDISKEKLLAGVSDEIDARTWQTLHPEGAIEIESFVLKGPPDTLAIAVNLKDVQLHFWINQFIALKRADGTLFELHKKYIENDLWKKDIQ